MLVALFSAAVSSALASFFGLLGPLAFFFLAVAASAAVRGDATAELLGGALASVLFYGLLDLLKEVM